MTKTYNSVVFIGRFQVFHNGHFDVIKRALTIADHVAIVIGSANAPRTIRNPFTYEERKKVILESFPIDADRIHISPLEDTIYNDELWVKNIQTIVNNTQSEIYGPHYNLIQPALKIALIGHSKDQSSFYLKLFPQWNSVEVPNYKAINSSDIRDFYFSTGGFYMGNMPDASEKFMTQFYNTEQYNTIKQEFMFVQNYKDSWASAPFPPVFITTDAVVVQSGHILLIERGHLPGKGLWALPGGFLNQGEKIIDGVIRELREETKIKVPAPVLKGNIVKMEVFDDPNRSSRGRTITHAALIHLPPQTELPKVKGADDAAKAKWFPISSVTRNMMFEDHKDVIDYMLGFI